MRGRRQNGKQSGSVLQQQGKSRHQQRGLGVRHLLQLLVLLAAQQGFSVPEVKVVSTAMLKASTAVAGFLLAPQPAQAQSITLTATPLDGGRVRLDWTRHGSTGLHVRQWGYQQNGGAWIRIPGDGNTLNHTVTGLKVGVAYSFKVHLFASTSGPSIIVGTESNVATATPFAPPVLSVKGNPDGGIVASWTYSGYFPAGGKWQYKKFPHPQGGTSFVDAGPRAGVADLRNLNIFGSTTGVRYAVQVRLVDTNGNEITRSNFALATPGGSVAPTLVSDPSKTVRVGSEGTILVCYNLLSVIHNGITYLESRPGKTRVNARSELRNTVHGVEITEAPAVIRSSVVGVGNVNFDPCATVGPGVHSVTWQWNGLNGLATQAGRTTTTFTVLAANRPAKPINFTATPGNAQVTLTWNLNLRNTVAISHYEMQRKEGTGNYGGWTRISVTGTGGSTKLTHPVTGLTNGTEYGFRVRAVNANGAGVPSDEQLATPANKIITLTSDQSNNRITEGNSGTKDVVITATLGQPAPSSGVSGTILFANQGTTAKGSNSGSNPCTPPLDPADTDYCYPSGANFTIAEGATEGTVTIKIIGDTRNESNETIKFLGQASGWTTGTLTLTIVDDDSSVTGKNIAISVASATIAEGNTGKTDVTVTYALGESPSNALFLDLDVVAASTTATDNTNVGATSCTAPSSNADVCYPGAGANQKRFSISRTTSGSFKIGILGDTKDEPNETFAFRLTPISTSLSDGWTASNTLTLTITDDDEPTPGVTVTGSPLTVAEGGTGTYTVKLDTSPSATVTVTPTSSDTGAATVSPASHTFNSGDYGTPKTFTVTGEQDQNADDETVTITHAVTGGDYASVTAPSVSVTVTDDEDPVLTPVLTGAANSATNGQIDLTWTHGGGSTPEKYVSGNVLSTPTAIFWQAHHRLKGAASWTLWSNTSVAQGRARRTVSLSLRNIYPAGASVELRVRTAATDTSTGAEINGPWSNIRTVAAYANTNLAALTLVGDPVTVAAGATKTYTVALTKAFAGTLSLSSSDTTKATVSPPTLTFTTGNYNTAQTVTVTGVATGGSPSIGHAFRLTGASADAIPDAGTVSVTVEAAAANAPVLTTATSTTSGRISLTWTHAGTAIGDLVSGAANFSGWQAQTRIKGGSWSNETVRPGSSRTNIAIRSARVQPGDDYPGGAVVQVRIRARGYVTGTSGTQANGPWSNARDVTYKNDNLAALTFTGNPLTVTASSSSTYTVKLTKAYGGVLSVTSGATDKATVDPASLTFTTSDYNTAQTVTVTGVEAGQATINHAFRLTGASADAIPDAGTVSVTVNPLPAKPTNFTATAGNGQVTLNWSDPDDATITRWEYQQKTSGGNFGTSWNAMSGSGASTTSHTVTSLTNNTAYTFRIRAVSAAGNGAVSDERSATPVAATPAGVTVSVATLTVDEGNSGAYTMRLNTAPSNTVTITVGGASGDVTVDPASLTFTTTNYADPQTVTVSAGEDGDTENDSATLTHSASGDTSYGSSLTIASVRVTVTDNDTPGGSGGGGGGNNPSAPTTPSIAAPAQPTGLTAKIGNAQVALSWSSPDNATITKWQVQQKQGDGSYGAWVDIPGSTASTTSHTVTGLTNGTAYSFRIRAVNAGGNSPASAEVRATPLAPPVKPTGVTATAGHAQVTLSWNNPDNATISKWQYQQKQGDGSYGPWMDIPDSTASTTSHTVTGLTNGTVYSFRIRAVNAGGNGAPSDEVTATPIDQDMVQADKARSQALAATSRTLLGMATNVLGSRSGGEAPVALAGAGNTLGEQAMGIVENLLGIGGSELPTALTLEDVEDRLWSQSFQLTPPAKGSDGQQEWNPPSPQQRSWALWGAGELRSYRGNDDAEHLSYSGNMKTAWLGVDHQFTDRWMAGAALSFATGQSDYSYRKTDGSKDGGKMESRLTTFYPYGSFQVSEGLRLWGMAGMGWGTQHHRQTGDHTKAEGDLRLQMGVIGFERSLSPIGELSLSLAGDAGLVKSTTDWKAGSGLDDLDVSLHRIRLGIDSSFPLAEHTTGYLNLKGRLDGGDLEMNAAEIVAGLHYGKERFSGFLQGRQTYAFDGSYAESALTAQLRLTANSDGTGLAWTLQPSYGNGDGDMALAAGPSLWTDEQLEALTGSDAAQQSGEIALSSRVGYGIRLQSSDLLLTPFTEVHLWEAGSQHIGLGLALEGNSWNVELSSSTEKGANASPTTKTELSFSKRL